MTVCIAALYEDGDGVVLASDHMVTTSYPMPYEFENDEMSKIHRMSEHAPIFALAAGDLVNGNEMLDHAQMEVARQEVARENGITADQVAEIVRMCYSSLRLKLAVSLHLEPRGMDHPTFISNQNNLTPQLAQYLDQAIAQFDIGVELIVAGPTNEKVGIYQIVHPGVIINATSIGYAAIGSGAPHAIYSFIEQPYKQSFNRQEAEAGVQAAKRRSEVAPGVGEKTSTEIVCIAEEETDARSG